MNARRDTARRWVIDEGRTEDETLGLIQKGYDEGPARIEMEGYVNEARAELKWWGAVEKAYRASGYMPSIDLVAHELGIGSKTLRKQARDHGIRDWRQMHERLGN